MKKITKYDEGDIQDQEHFSLIPQQQVTLYLPSLHWLWPAIVVLSAAAAILANFVFVDIAIRPLIILWFLCICPGMVAVRFLHLKEPIVEWTLAIALSLAIDATIAAVQLYAGWWSPAATLSILASFSVGAVVAPLVYQRMNTSNILE